jgi:hypothetical protein
MQSKDHRGAIEDLTAAQAHSERLVSSNADDSISRAYLAEASANIGFSERRLASSPSVDGAERTARRLRACAALTRALDAYRTNEKRGTANEQERRDAALVEQQLAACR